MEEIKKISQPIPNYTVGKISHLFGIAPQTLRYFDSVGLIPNKNPESGRRTYSIWNVHKITLRKIYQNIGFSSKEAEQVLKNYTVNDIKDKLSLCEKRFQEQERILHIRQAGLRRLQKQLDNLGKCYHRYSFTERPAMWRHIHIEKGRFLDSPGAIKARQILLHSIPLSSISFAIDSEKHESEPYGKWYITAEEPYGTMLEFDKIPTAEFIPAQQCIYTTFAFKGEEFIRWEIFDRAFAFMESMGLKICGEVIGSNILEALGNNVEETRYYEVFIPFKSEKDELP